MKSLGHKCGGGNINLKGKQHKLCSCGCCTMINVKQKYLKKEHENEIKKERKMTDTI